MSHPSSGTAAAAAAAAAAATSRRLVSFAYSNGTWRHVSSVPSPMPQSAQQQQQQHSGSSSNSKQQVEQTPVVIVPGGGWASQELRSYNVGSASGGSAASSPNSNSKSASSGSASQHQLQHPAASYRVLALFEGNFDAQGRRHGWGTLRVFRHLGRVNNLACISIACRWEADVPQIEWDPCRLVEELMRNPQEFLSVAAAPTAAEETPACELYNESGRKLASVYNGLMLAISQDFTSDRYTGLQWAMSTQFLPHTLGEKHDLIAMPTGNATNSNGATTTTTTTAGVKYCGQWQMGERHGFGMERQVSSGGLIYAGPYDGGERHGVALLFDHASRTCLDATWNAGRIADCPGALHVQGFPISVLGRWSGDSAVAQGRLVRANGASGVWETLFAEFDEQMPALQMEVEAVIAAARGSVGSPASGTNLHSSTATVGGGGGGGAGGTSPNSSDRSFQGGNSGTSHSSLAAAASGSSGANLAMSASGTAPPANLSPMLLGLQGNGSTTISAPLPQILAGIIDSAMASVTAPVASSSSSTAAALVDIVAPSSSAAPPGVSMQWQKDFVSELGARLSLAREEVMCVCEPIALVLAMPQMRALLCVFQRCFLFSYGTCSPSGEDVGGGPMTAADMALATPPARSSGEEEAALVAAAQASMTMGTGEVAQAAAVLAAAAQHASAAAAGNGADGERSCSATHRAGYAAEETDDVFLAPKASMSWCSLAVRDMCQRSVIPSQFAQLSQQSHLLCIHRARAASRDSELELFQRAVEDATALVISVRLRLMNLVNSTLAGGAGTAVSSPTSMATASAIISGPGAAEDSPTNGNNNNGNSPNIMRRITGAASSAAGSNRHLLHAAQNQPLTLEELSFAAAVRDPSIAPFLVSGTPLSGSARAAACAWDAVLDVALAPLLKHASNVCRIENAKFLVAARRLVVNCGSSNRIEFRPSDFQPRGRAGGSSFSSKLQQQQLPPLLAIDLISMLIPAQLLLRARFGRPAPNASSNNATVDAAPETDGADSAAAAANVNANATTTMADAARQQLRHAILNFAGQLVTACKLLSQIFTEGQLSEMHMACASESTQSGLLFGFFRRFNRPQQSQQGGGGAGDNAAGKQRLRSSKSERLKRVGVEGAVSSLVGAATACCVCVREAAHAFSTSVLSALAVLEAEQSSSQQQQQQMLLSSLVNPREALHWGLRFVACYSAINASSPRAILPQLLLLDTICEAEASEVPHPNPIDEMCCSLFGMWRGDLPGIAAVPLGTGAAFPVTLLGQWSIRSLRSAIAEVTTLCNTPCPLRYVADDRDRANVAVNEAGVATGATAVDVYATSCSSAVFVCDVKAHLSAVLRDIALAPDYVRTSAAGVSGSPATATPSTTATPRPTGGSTSPHLGGSPQRPPGSNTFESQLPPATAQEVLQRAIDPMFLPRNRGSWYAAVRDTHRRPIVAERQGDLDVGTTSESLGYFSTSQQQQQKAFSSSTSASFAGAARGSEHHHHHGSGGSGGGGHVGGEVHVSDHGLAATVDKALAALKASSKSVNMNWAQHQQLVSSTTAGGSKQHGSAFDGASPLSALLSSPGVASARGDRAASVFSPGSAAAAGAATVTVPLQSDAHEAELGRRLARFHTQVLRVLGLRLECSVKREAVDRSSDDSSDDNDLFSGTGTGGGGGLSGSAGSASSAAAKKRLIGGVTTAAVRGNRKMTIRILPSESRTQQMQQLLASVIGSPQVAAAAASSSNIGALSEQALLADESEVIDEDSLEDVLEWWTGARSRIKGQVARM